MHTRLVLAVVFAAVVAVLLAPVVGADGGGRPFRLVLSGAAERPGPGDPDGTGTAMLRLNPGQGEVCYDYTTSGIARVAAAHIHVAPVTQPGPVVIPLPPTSDTGGSGCVTASRVLILEIIRNPQNYYFNAHTSEFPAGALRAQLG